jgi:hypothetical protein
MKKNTLLIVFVAFALVILLVWGVRETDAPDYTMFSTGKNGVSLLYDTLKHLGYPVAAGQNPVNENAYVNDVFIIIKPNNPRVDAEAAERMLAWVRKGGRLIYLDGEFPNALDRALEKINIQPVLTGEMHFYILGMGEIFTGNADFILNTRILNETKHGQFIEFVLYEWNAPTVWFAEYYHGYRKPENFYSHLPDVVKLALFQLVIITCAVVWHLGKRFGKPQTYYEEIEREENEHVKALANLYWKKALTTPSEFNNERKTE